MKLRISLLLVFSMLLVTGAFASGHKLAATPSDPIVFLNGPANSVQLNGFCNESPCNLHWSVILSNSGVGSIDKTAGPDTMFTAGSRPGTAYVFLTDEHGNAVQVIVKVQ